MRLIRRKHLPRNSAYGGRELGLGMTTMTPYLLDAPSSRGRDLRADLLPIFTGGVALAAVCGFGLWFVSPPSPPADRRFRRPRRRRAPAAPPGAGARRRQSVRRPGRIRRAPSPRFAAWTPTLRGRWSRPSPIRPPDRGPDAALGASRSLGPVVGALERRRPPPPSRRPLSPLNAPLPPKRESPASTIRRRCRRRARAEFAALESPPRPTRRSGTAARSSPRCLRRARHADLATPAAPAKTSIFSIFNPQPTRPAGYDDHTAVYDITARALYLPDGTDRGAFRPRRVHGRPQSRRRASARRDPPDLYDLQPRESLFHGIAAIRLVPVGGEEAVYGRAGLLAHPFMMGDNGDSNGCVSIKDYDAFLKAFQDGKVTRLAVVAKI